MENNIWYDAFIEILYKKFPKKSHLTQALIDLLEIEREAVYRRLRKDVIFPAHEVVKIASAWNISLDEVTEINAGQISFQMRPINYVNPSEEETNFIKSIIESIRYQKDSNHVEFMSICNKIPRLLYAGFYYLNKFYLFKMTYLYFSKKEAIPFSQVIIPQEKLQLIEDYYEAIKFVPNTSLIWDHRIFEYLINDIKYFHSIYMITDEEKELIKNDLYTLLDYMQEVANKGCYPETQKKVNLYISQVNIETNYSYVYTSDTNVCFVHAFEKFEILSYNSKMVADFIAWMQLKKRTSIQISEVDERSRIEFFTRQRKLLENI